MSNSCVVIPHIQAEDGQYIESSLFNNLLHYSNDDRNFALTYYRMATDPEFLRAHGEQLSYDENGEVTFKSLKNLTKFDINKEKLLVTLNRDLGAGTLEYQTAMDRLQNFNRNSQYSDEYMATVEEADGGKYELSVVERTGRNEEKLYKTIRNRNLQDRIIYQLNKHGVSVKFLQEGSSRYSTENAERTADGYYALVSLAKGENQTEDLAEEAGHFAVGALGNNPLVQRLINSLTPEVQKAILGDAYEAKVMGTDDRREVAGTLVGRALANQIDRRSALSSLVDRIVNLAKKTFAKFTQNDILLAKVRAEEAAEQIAEGFMSKDFQGSLEDALATKETLYRAETPISTQVFNEVLNTLYATTQQLKNIGGTLDSNLTTILLQLEQYHSAGKPIDEQTSLFSNLNSITGLAVTMDQITDMFREEIPSLLNSISFSNSYNFARNMRENGQKIQELRTFIRNAATVAKLLGDRIGGTTSSEYAQIASVGPIQVTDPKTGQATTIGSLESLQRNLSNIIGTYSEQILKKEKDYFIRFLKETYGDDYVRTADMRVFKPGSIFSTEVKKGFTEETKEKFSISHYVDVLEEDVSLFDYFLGSMSNSSDVVSQIVDKAIKGFNKMADDETNKVWDNLKILRSKFVMLQKSGVIGKRDSEIFYERYRGTNQLTGNFRTQYFWGDYERDFLEFKQQLTRTFWEKHAQEFILDGKTLNRSEYDLLSDEEKARVKFGRSDLDGFSVLRKELEWDVFSRKEILDWRKAHSVWDEGRGMWVPNDEYVDQLYWTWGAPGCTIYKDTNGRYLTEKEYDKLSEPEQSRITREEISLRSLMEEFLSLKEQLDTRIDGQMPYYRAPQVKGAFGKKVANSVNQDESDRRMKKARAFGKTLRKHIIDKFCEDSDDTDFGSAVTYNTIDDDVFKDKLFFEKEKLARLPLFFINKLKDTTDLSTDIFHAMLSYASMANSYFASAQVVNAAEIGSTLLQQRRTAPGNNAGKVAGFFGEALTKRDDRGGGGLAYRRYLKYIERQIYSIGMKKLMVNKKVCATKIAGMLSGLASKVYLGGNVAGGAVNIGTGFNEMFKEACVGQFYHLNNFANAHKQYWSSSISNWANIGNLTKEDKVSLVIRKFDILGDQRSRQKGWYSDRNKFFGNFLYGESLMLPYSSGEHYMQSVTYLSLLDAIQLYDFNGNKIKAFDAYKVVNIEGGNKTLELLNGDPKNAGKDHITTTSLMDWANDIIMQKRPFREFIDRDYTEDELRVLRDAGVSEPHHSTPQDVYNALSESLVNKQLFFKEEEGKQKYFALQETLNKIRELKQGHTDVTFSDEELQMLKRHNVLADLNGDDAVTEDLEDAEQAVIAEQRALYWNEDDEVKFMDLAKEVSDRLHGIYNNSDKTLLHQTILGNMLLVMKGYALGMAQRRFGVAKYSTALDTDIEGSVRTLWKMISYAFTDRGGFRLTTETFFSCLFVKWDENKGITKRLNDAGFNKSQFYNMRRNVMDLLLIGILTLLKYLTRAKGDDDDDDEKKKKKGKIVFGGGKSGGGSYSGKWDDNIATGIVYYMSSRLLREQKAFNTPGAFLDETTNLFKIIPAGVSVLDDLGGLAIGMGGTALFPYYDGMTTNDPGGKFYYMQTKKGLYSKGDKKWVRKLYRMAPYYKSYLTFSHPYEAASSYDYGRKVMVK